MKSFLLIQPRPIIKKIYRKAIWNLGREEKTIYLTFDDGPIPGLSEWILDTLAIHAAKATFFCVGANIQKHRAIFERIQTEGHLTGNHTMFHTRGYKTAVSDYIAEVEECKTMIGNNLFRPPYGQMKRSQYNALVARGYKIILWDVISYDYENISEKKCANNVIKTARNGSIVLFHDNIKAEKNVQYALPKTLEHFSRLGYTFKTLASLSQGQG